MFTLEQIRTSHSQVKSGADFPAHIQRLITLGVEGYINYVADGHTIFTGSNNFSIESSSKYTAMMIASKPDEEQLKAALRIHQAGGTDYLTFCAQAAQAGVETWKVDMKNMTCTYYDKAGNKMVEELIPVIPEARS